MIVIMFFSVVILFHCGFPELEIFERGTFYLAPRFWEGSPQRGGASIRGPFGHFAMTFLGLFKTMTMTFFRTMT